MDDTWDAALARLTGEPMPGPRGPSMADLDALRAERAAIQRQGRWLARIADEAEAEIDMDAVDRQARAALDVDLGGAACLHAFAEGQVTGVVGGQIIRGSGPEAGTRRAAPDPGGRGSSTPAALWVQGTPGVRQQPPASAVTPPDHDGIQRAQEEGQMMTEHQREAAEEIIAAETITPRQRGRARALIIAADAAGETKLAKGLRRRVADDLARERREADDKGAA